MIQGENVSLFQLRRLGKARWQWSAPRGGPQEVRNSAMFMKVKGSFSLCRCHSSMDVGLTEMQYWNGSLQDRKQWFEDCAYFNSWVSFNGIYFTNYLAFFLLVLGLPPASEIPQYSPLPGACLEGQIHCECDTYLVLGNFHLGVPDTRGQGPFSYFLCEAMFSFCLSWFGGERGGHDGIKGITCLIICPWNVG